MLERITRIIGSFLLTAACYTAYAVSVVPWIEPPAPTIAAVAWTPDDLEVFEKNADRQRADLSYWFGDQDWELDSPKIIETPQGKLLFDEYRQLDNGLVELKPCSMVFLSHDATGDEESRKRRAMVLRAPSGALLRFDDDVSFKQAKIGKLIGGELLGEVQISGGQRLPGPEDDLLITTRDVMLSETDISTPHLLEYKLGGNRGRGRGLAIELDNVEVNGKRELRGIKMMTLHEQVFVHLENQGDGDFFPGNEPGKKAETAAADRKRSVPIEIRCSGPFTFDLVRDVAVFRKSVEVSRRIPEAEADQIYADLLKVYFISKAPAAGTVATTAPTAVDQFQGARQLSAKNLQPSRVEIVGEPAIIRAPTNQLQARAQFIEHDLATRAVKLRDADEAIVRQEEREIRTPELSFTPDADGRYGTFIADGRGRFTGASPDDPASIVQAEWKRRLHFRNHDGQYVLTAEGSARVEAVGKGALSGAEIHLWFKEISKPAPVVEAGVAAKKPATELVADRLLAVGSVHIDSPQVQGDVERLEAWFEHVDPGPGMRQAYYRPQAAGAVILAAVGAGELTFPPAENNTSANPQGLTFPPTAALPAPASPTPNPLLTAVPLHAAGIVPPAPAASLPAAASPAAAAPPVPLVNMPATGDNQYRIEGELMRLLIENDTKQMRVREATIERRVKLIETVAAAKPEEKPLLIQGDTLHLTQTAPKASFVTVTGTPAYVEARGMTMTGGKLTLDRPNEQTNIVGVPGQGLMTLPVDRDLQGRPTGATELLTLVWQGQLQFDGLTARFERGVEAKLTNQYLRTDRLNVTFTQQVAFGKSDNAQPDVQRIDCYDGVFLESRTLKEGSLTSVERMTARTLAVDRPSGDFTAEGPGEVTSVRLGSAAKPGELGGQQAAGPAGVPAIPIGFGDADPPQGDGAKTITYLFTRFQRGMAGNELRRELNFYNQVRVVRGPVPNWNATIDPDRPEGWGPQTVLIDCDQLQITAVPDAVTKEDSYNLVAAGNTLVEGNTFTARAPRVTFAQAKDLLVIEGDGRTAAELYHQKHVGGENSGTTAQRFMVWPSTNRVQVDGATFLDLVPR